MSTIYLDPVAMDATAGMISEHAHEVDAAVADLEVACSAEVPPSLAGWLAEELRDIAVHVRLAEVLYVVAALDTALRAQQMQADQSLAMAWPPLGTTDAGVTSTYDLGAILAGATVVGGTGPAFVNDFVGPTTNVVGGTGPAFVNDFPGLGPTVVGGLLLGASASPSSTGVSMPGLSSASFAAQNPFMGAASLGGGASLFGAGGFGAGPLDFAGAVANHSIANSLAPAGLDVVSPGIFEDERGRQGRLSQTHRDPRTNRLEF
jgi:hypothetical protein